MKDILVIDDEREVLDVVRSVLRTKGHTVRVASGGAEGIQMASITPPDLLVCDLMMPGMSGLAVIKHFRASTNLAHVPILILSPVEPTPDKPEAWWTQGLGVDEYLYKPFDPFDLLGRTEYLLRRNGYVSRKHVASQPAGGSRDQVPISSVMAQAAADAPAGGANDPRLAPGAAPADVATLYTECWNRRDWATEYACLADDLRGAFTLEVYASGRAQTAHEESTRTQKVVRVIGDKVSGNVAKIELEREDVMGGRPWRKLVTVALKKTHEGWRVLRTTEAPLRRDAAIAGPEPPVAEEPVPEI